MIRTFNANIFRLKKSRLFWWAMVLTALATAGGVMLCCLAAEGDLSEYALESYALSGAPALSIVNAVTVILFLGTDNSGRTVRNKIMVGNKRGGIYAANMLTGAVIGCSVTVAWLVGGLVGVPILGWWKMPLTEVAVYIASLMACAVAVSAAAALVSMLIQSKSGAVVVGLVAAIVLMFCAGRVYTQLGGQKEVMTTENIDGELQFELIENPNYIEVVRRAAYELALNVNPLGSSIALSNCDLKDPIAGIAGAGFVTVFISALGAAVFRRKDLR